VGTRGTSVGKRRVRHGAWPRHPSRGGQSRQTFIACTAIGTLFVGLMLVELMQDSDQVLPVASIDQPLPRAHAIDRDSVAKLVTNEPREHGCGDFAFFFLNPTCGKTRVRHVTHAHRVATLTITASTSAANRPPPITNNKPNIARRTNGKTISGTPGDGAAEQMKLHTAMRVAPE
jgi:hypothetical protein